MAAPDSQPDDSAIGPALPEKAAGRSASQNQTDFEMDFFGGVLRRDPSYVDALRVMGDVLTRRGYYARGLRVDQRLVKLRPEDPLVRYNLACSYSLLGYVDAAIKELHRAIALGYKDYAHMKNDADLENVRNDPRYRRLLKQGGRR